MEGRGWEERGGGEAGQRREEGGEVGQRVGMTLSVSYCKTKQEAEALLAQDYVHTHTVVRFQHMLMCCAHNIHTRRLRLLTPLPLGGSPLRAPAPCTS